MSVTQEDGSSLKDHLLLIEKTTGKPQEKLQTGEVPNVCSHVWNWFLKLHKKRSSNGFSVNPITYTEMQSFFKLHGLVPENWEIELIEALDDIVLDSIAKNTKTK